MSGLPFPDDAVAKPKRAKKPKAEADSVVVRLFDVYHRAFVRRWNACAAHRAQPCRRCVDAEWQPLYPDDLTKPLYEGGRDGRAFKDLADAWGEQEVARLIGVFFATTDLQIVRSDYKVSVFRFHAQRLRLLSRGSGQDDRTLANIDAVTRATTRRR